MTVASLSVPFSCECGAAGLAPVAPALLAEFAGSGAARAEELADRGQRAVFRLQRLKDAALCRTPTQGEVLAAVDAALQELTAR